MHKFENYSIVVKIKQCATSEYFFAIMSDICETKVVEIWAPCWLSVAREHH